MGSFHWRVSHISFCDVWLNRQKLLFCVTVTNYPDTKNKSELGFEDEGLIEDREHFGNESELKDFENSFWKQTWICKYDLDNVICFKIINKKL